MASKRNRVLKTLVQRQFNRVSRPSIKRQDIWEALKTMSLEKSDRIVDCLRSDTGEAEIGHIIKTVVYAYVYDRTREKLLDKYQRKDIPPEDLIDIV